MEKKIEFETLHSNKYRIYLLCGIVCVVVLMVTLIITTSKAKYRTTQSMPLLQGTINYAPYDYKAVAMFLDGESIDTLPSGNYTLTSESYCTNEDNVKDESIKLSYDSNTQGLLITPMNKKGTKCYLYFEEKILGGNYILANEGGAVAIEEKETPNFAKAATTDEGMYATKDDYGTSYYYRGAVNDNWMKFGTNSSGQDLYWRIIRVNGDGTIRLIYNGTTTAQTGESTQIGTSAFNSSYNDNMYVGYMYGKNSSDYNITHANTNNSTIKEVIDTWYQNNLTDEAEYIEGSSGFCGDREPSTNRNMNNGLGGTETNVTYYGAYIRLDSNKSPILTCANDSDLYTLSKSSKGNQALNYPIGLITADEVAMAGGMFVTTNRNYYLYTNSIYWTLSPYYFSANGNAHVFYVYSDGMLSNGSAYWPVYGVRPVINLRADVPITGSGATSDPFKIETS